MFAKTNIRTQHNIYLILQIIILARNGLAYISERAVDLYPDKYDDLYDDDKLQNNVWMNIFGVYPTLSTNNTKSRTPNLTQEYFPIDKNIEKLKVLNEQDKVNIEVKSIEKSKVANKWESPSAITDKTILEMIQDTPLYQLCLRSVNVAETCLAIILNSNNIRKMYADKQRVCGNLATWSEYRLCIQQFPSEDEHLTNMAIVKKNNKVADTPKRLPFHAWGGKRFNQVGTEKIQTSRVPFNAWGGKRTQIQYEPYGETCEPCKRSKAKFHSWGGKRTKRKVHI